MKLLSFNDKKQRKYFKCCDDFGDVQVWQCLNRKVKVYFTVSTNLAFSHVHFSHFILDSGACLLLNNDNNGLSYKKTEKD